MALWDEEEVAQIIEEMDAGGYHAVPNRDIAPHKKCPSCWCQPVLIFRNPKERKEVWVHMDASENPN